MTYTELNPKVVKLTSVEFKHDGDLSVYIKSNNLFDDQDCICVIYKHKPTGRKLIKNVWQVGNKTKTIAHIMGFYTCETHVGLWETDAIKQHSHTT